MFMSIVKPFGQAIGVKKVSAPHQRPPRRPTWRWFFPLAALHAALIVPLSLLALYHECDILSHLASPAAHARELLFGFALAVIVGYLLGPLTQRQQVGLVGLWLVLLMTLLITDKSRAAEYLDWLSRLRIDQRRPDLRPTAADRGKLRHHPGQDYRAASGSHRRLQLRALA